MKIVIADDMENEVLGQINNIGSVSYKPADLKKEMAGADVLVVRSKTKVTDDLLESAGKLKAVIRAGVGLDNIDVDACSKRNIRVLNTPTASSNAVAELTIGHVISAFRFMAKAHWQMKSGIWDKKGLVGREISGKTMGIVGYGRIGSLVAKKAAALGMKVIAYNEPRKEDPAVEFVGLDELFASSDVVSLHLPLKPETKNIINKKTIAKMKNGVVLINTARGELIDEEALYEACRSGKIAAACLDVFTEEPYRGKLLELENVYCTPHIGASTKEAQMRIGEEIVNIIKAMKASGGY